MIKSTITRLIFFFVCSSTFAQQTPLAFVVEGFVYERTSQGSLEPLPGAHIFCLEDQRGAVSDEFGAFFFQSTSDRSISLVTSFVGYESDTIEVKKEGKVKIVLQPKTLLEVSLLDRRKTNGKSLLQVNNVEWISAEELHKAACCNLSESFETNPSVDVSFTDALTGAKQIQMLGLDGVYAQVLFENKPFLRGLSSSYGLNFLPGTWIESIQISKGTGSVVNGFESLSGQINIELYKPQTSPKLLWNTYLNSSGLLENNFVVSPFLEGAWQTALLGHYSYFGEVVDNNKDGFVEAPQVKRLSLLNRWEYLGYNNRHIAFGLRYLSEEKVGGQFKTGSSKTDPIDFEKAYEVNLQTEQVEAHTKTGFIFDKPGTSLGLISTFRYHNQNTFFGNSHYKGKQQSVYLNATYQSNFGDDSKSYKVGASYYGDDYQERLQLRQLSEKVFSRKDQTLGVFGEIQYKPSPRFSTTLGVRADRSRAFDMLYSPRLHLRYNPIENAVLRASVGKAYRQANIFAENISYFYSSRSLEMQDPSLAAEEAWNYGVNFTYNTHLYGKETSLNIDFYQTDFSKQVVVDLEESQHIKIYNLTGQSLSKSLQLDATIEPYEGWELKYAHKWNETKTTYESGFGYKAVPFVPKYRSMAQVSYSPWQNKWDVNITVQNVGPSRVPEEKLEGSTRSSYWSPKFQLVSAQYTKRFKKVDWYLGIENLLNYLQKNPIRNFQEPYSEGFDAAMIWGPTHSRKLYTGIRLLIND
jgi:outer membrane receptor for ferrienterochelin and colicins